MDLSSAFLVLRSRKLPLLLGILIQVCYTLNKSLSYQQIHADENASQNIASRLGDQELRAYTKRDDIKALLLKRHEQWKQNASLVVVQAPVQLGLWTSSEVSTDVG
jgi:hypothetical protein